MDEQQTQCPTVFCENQSLENVFKFSYLGSVFAADGLQEYDNIRKRVGMTMTQCGKFGHIFDSPDLGPWLKVRFYCAVVVSLITFECE